ncbi:MAG: hypothetical protein EBU23_15100, partial [Mycobacteriaceae bacterium]|nr:hypothetical protein [Mycobacteriaceae bacterium]
MAAFEEFVYLTGRDGLGKPAGRAVEARYSRADLAARPVVRDEARGRFLVFADRAAQAAAYAAAAA